MISMIKGGILMSSGVWYRVPDVILKDRRLTLSDVACFAVIADRADGAEAELTRAQIAELTELSDSSVKRAIQKLEKLHYISVQRQSGAASIYRQLVLEAKRRGGRPRKPQSDISKYEELAKIAFERDVLGKEVG